MQIGTLQFRTSSLITNSLFSYLICRNLRLPSDASQIIVVCSAFDLFLVKRTLCRVKVCMSWYRCSGRGRDLFRQYLRVNVKECHENS